MLLEPPPTVPKSFRLNDTDLDRIELVKERTGIHSATEAVRYALKAATEPGAVAPRDPTAALAALKAWNPGDFEGIRARAVVEDFLRSRA